MFFVGDFLRDCVLCFKVGLRIILCDSYCVLNLKLGWVWSDGFLNNFVRVFVGEIIVKIVGVVGLGKELVMVEDNVEDIDVRGWKGRVVIIVGLIGVGKFCLVLVFVKCLRGEIISVDLV